jgi:ribosomal protein L4
MKIDVVDINNKKSGTIELNSSLFGLEPRPDILNKVVRWQLAKRQQGTHSVLTRSEVSYSTKKLYDKKVQVVDATAQEEHQSLEKVVCIKVLSPEVMHFL